MIANRTDELFSIIAKEEGVIKEITKNTLTVQYKTLGEHVYEIGTIHGIVSGTTIPHNLVCDLKVNAKFKANSIIAYNEGFFQRSEFNKETVVYKTGVIARIALLECTVTNEDSCLVTTKLAEKLSTPTTKVYTIVLDNTQVINNVVSIGDKIDPDSILCTVSSYVEDQDKIDDETMKALQKISANNPKAKMYGKVSNIECIYFCNIEDMNSSIRALIKSCDKLRGDKANKLTKPTAKTGKIDETIQIGGRKLVEGQVVLKIYIDGEIPLGIADKVVFANGLKSTVGGVDTESIISVNDGKPIDGFFGQTSVSARIVLSPSIMGTANTVIKTASKRMADIYFGNVKR